MFRDDTCSRFKYILLKQDLRLDIVKDLACAIFKYKW